MNGPPQPDGKECKRDIDKPDNSENGTKVCSLMLSYNAPEHEIG